MTDWSKFKVTDLREECKSRGIPLTGLKLKQQYIDKLEETDAQHADSKGSEAAMEEPQSEAHPDEADPAPREEDLSEVDDNHKDLPGNDEARESEQHEPRQEDSPSRDTIESQGPQPDHSHESTIEGNATLALESANSDENAEGIKSRPVEPSGQKALSDSGTEMGISSAMESQIDRFLSSPKPDLQSTPLSRSTQLPSDSSTLTSSQVLSSDLAEDQRKRKRRSLTPVPSSEEMARKKAKISDDTETSSAAGASAVEQEKIGSQVAMQTNGETANSSPAEGVVEQTGEVTTITEPLIKPTDATQADTETTEHLPSMSPERSRSPSEERDVIPAIHPATSSVYIRNFKRPLHIPSLRNYIVSIAKSRSSNDADPITVFYLDSIRTHAFVSFNSVTAAYRVRSAMHQTRFPNESMREPLFVDYVPTDQVQRWIDQESAGGFGRGGRGRRYEVVYEEKENGVEAIFQEVDATKQRPPLEPRTSHISVDRSKTDSLPPGLHPDRATLVSRDLRRDRNGDRDLDIARPPASAPKNSRSTGTGFKALDELFSSTTAKPKLYYKPISDAVAQDRISMFRALRVGHVEMGRSGDEGMKRYTFERHNEREEWVDKGPEFGYGKRGQERLAGFRGRGGGFRGRGDSYRGGSGR